jgi:thiol-disulfide isomerase/thioredoxin
MRTILVGIAGRELVSRERGGERAALARLQACEAFVAGDPPDRAMASWSAATPSFPPVSAELRVLQEISPSWLGVNFRAAPPEIRAEHRLPAGANLLDVVYPDSPAQKAGLQAGDILLGPPGHPFASSRELREWTMTAPPGVPLALAVVRPGEQARDDRRFEATLTLRLAPVDLPRLPGPPLVGDRAPVLPALKPVGSSELPDLKARPYILFFWATWCEPCKKAVPEVMAFAESRGLPILAISDEEEDAISTFLASRTKPFIPRVARDPLRKSFVSYGVSGTPTILLVDAEGMIRHRQVGYTADKGLIIEGWPGETGPLSRSGRR